MERDTVLILDFGSQYTQLIARRLRELQVYSEVLPPSTKAKALADRRPKGIVLSGGPDSVHEGRAPFLPATEGPLFRGLSARSRVWMSHVFFNDPAPAEIFALASTEAIPI